MLSGASGASLVGNILADKGLNRPVKVLFRAGYESSIKNKDF